MGKISENIAVPIERRKSETLAAHIVIYKTLNIDRETALLCMAELGRRRALGDEFDYETFIEAEVEKIPKVNSNLPELYKIINFKNILGKK
jgi:hypothetical protein